MKRRTKINFKNILICGLVFIAILCSLILVSTNLFVMETKASGGGGSGDGTDNPSDVFDLKVYYYIESTETEIYPHFHSTYIDGDEYSVTSPEIIGYTISDDNNKIITGNISEDTVYKVYYTHEQEYAQYTVNYYTMEVNGENLSRYKQITKIAKVNEIITVPLEVIPGYSWSISDLLLVVTNDGKAVKNLYYTKTDFRTIAFRTGTGHAQTITERPDTDITSAWLALATSIPTRIGYDFVKWKIEGDEEGDDSLLQPDTNGVYYMPQNDMVVTAVWAVKEHVKYNVEFYFEKADSDNHEDFNNYVKNSELDETRDDGIVGQFAKMTDKDKNIANQSYLFDNFTKNQSQDTNVFEGTQADYLDSPFLGFDYYSVQMPLISADETSVLKIYYRREIWTLNLWEYPNKTDGNDTACNSVWKSTTGKYNSPINTPTFDYTFDTLSDYYGSGTIFCSQVQDIKGITNNRQKLVRFFSDSTFYVTLQDILFTGTYTKDGSTYTMTVTRKNGAATTKITDMVATYQDSNKLLTLSYKDDGEAHNNIKFYQAQFRGLTERNKNNTSDNTTIQNKRFIISAQDVISGTIDMCPFYSTISLIEATRTIYALPSGYEPSGTVPATNIITDKGLTQIYTFTGMTQTGGTLSAPAFTGYKLAGGYFRIAESEASIEGVAWEQLTDSSKPCKISGDKLDKLSYNCSDYVNAGKPRQICQFLLYPQTSSVSFYVDNEPLKTSGLQKTIEVGYNQDLTFLNETVDPTDVEYGLDNTGDREFKGWYLDASFTQSVVGAKCTQYQNATWHVYAKWETKKVYVTFNCMGGKFSDSASTKTVRVSINGGVSRPEDPTKEGFTFVNWYTATPALYSFGSGVSGDLVLYAVWIPLNLAEYRVYHYLKDGANEIEIVEYTKVGYDLVGETLTFNALTTNSVSANGIGYYIDVDAGTGASQSLEIVANTVNVVKFYYNKQNAWSYTVSYLNREGVKIFEDEIVENSDMIHVILNAKHKDGYAMIMCDGSLNSGTEVLGQRGPGYLSVNLSVSNALDVNHFYIYYDVVYPLTFNLQGATSSNDIYNVRYLLEKETTTLPVAPQYAQHIFLSWNTQANNSGDTYHADDTIVMNDYATTIYAQWAEVSLGTKEGRLLKSIPLDTSVTPNIASNGAITASFDIEDNNSYKGIAPDDFRLISKNGKFPAHTVITLIIIQDYKSGMVNRSFYYYKVPEDITSVKLTDFVKMGNKTAKFSSVSLFGETNVNKFICQVCVNYPGVTGGNNFCISSDDYYQTATNINFNFAPEINLPDGDLQVNATSLDADNFEATATVLNLTNLSANYSDVRNIDGTISNYQAVLVIQLYDERDNLIPFPKNSVIKINDIQVKDGGKVLGVFTYKVSNGSYKVEISGLQTLQQIVVNFSLTIADNSSDYEVNHPNRLQIANQVNLNVNYTKPVQYSINAELSQDEVNRVFTQPTEDKPIVFNLTFTPIAGTPNVTVYKKQGTEYLLVDWNVQVEKSATAGGLATATIIVPQGATVGTYRIEFTIGTATYRYNIIITE